MPAPKTFNAATLPTLTGRTILITGGTAGLGAATTAHLAALSPARIVFTGRDAARADAALARLRAAYPAVSFAFAAMDLADLASVRAAAASLAPSLTRLDILICNAGIMAVPPATTAQGLELQAGTNHVGHALLVAALLPALRAAAGRVVLLTSQAYGLARGVALDALDGPLGGCADGWWGGWARYAQSKLANLLYARALAAREPGLCVVAVHPGVIRENGLVRDLDWRSRWLVAVTTVGRTLSPEQGGLNAAWAAAAERGDVESGAYYEPVGVGKEVTEVGRDVELADSLWDWTQKEIQPWL